MARQYNTPHDTDNIFTLLQGQNLEHNKLLRHKKTHPIINNATTHVLSYLLAASLEPHEHRGHAGLAVHQPDLLPELCVLEHALLVQLNALLQYT